MNNAKDELKHTLPTESIVNSVKNELKQTPIASTASALAAIVSLLSLLYALAQTSVSITTTSSNPSLQAGVNPNNIFLIIAFFLSATFFCGFILKRLATKHDISALILSVPILSLINFTTVLVVYLTPPRQLSEKLFENAHDLVFYSSACIFLVFFAKPVLADLAKPGNNDNDNDIGGGAVLIIGIIILMIWGGFISGGQKMLSRTFLPEIAQPTEKVASKKQE